MRTSGKASEKLFYKPFRGNAGVMSTEDQIRWVTVILNFSPEEEAGLEKQASDAGLSLKCYCGCL